MPRTTHHRLDDAIEILDREIEYVTDERRAFRRFTSHVRDREPEPAAVRTTGGGDTLAVSAGGHQVQSKGLQSVTETYAETVMAVPHYDEVYGEGLAENLRAEFGAEIATQIVDGQQLTPVLRETIVAAGARATTEREEFGATLETERDSLVRIRDRLSEIESRTAELGEAIGAGATSSELGEYDAELTRLESACERLATRRQRLLHRRSGSPLAGVDADSLIGFLYGDRAVTCPALTEITDCLGTIRGQRERCLR
ncbi:hypothetical protein ACFQL1_22985 [Halomicroarcula sp. GCM10025709]|uniref:DUF7260 family protein n=1 Tax=Haloarcula TaxID=2237 RepID=UPI0024C3EB22|nr:hypothetical protein [Halomicroarcula sp. YJ-61-S]